MGIFFSDGLASGNQNQSAGLVLGPWIGGWAKGIRIDKDGKVGIGEANPQEELDVSGDVHVDGYLQVDGAVNIDGAVGIGVSSPAAKLHIQGDLKIQDVQLENQIELSEDGSIHCRLILVDQDNIPDYVFEEDYPLMPLEDLKEFVQTHKHLPNIRSEQEYEELGHVDLGELSVKLLEKVEELTLYTLILEERVRKLENQKTTQK
jgi:hypothetical protein